MNKTILTIFIFCITVMSSCCIIEPVSQVAEEEYLTKSELRSGMSGENDPALVRIGIYETIDNHSVSIINMRIEGSNPNVELPLFGDNFISAGVLSSDKENPTFDMEEGDFHGIIPTGATTKITIHFDAVVKCEKEDYSITVTDAKITIPASRTNWKSGRTYNYVLCIDADTLGLTEITFNPTVTDYEDVNV